MAVKQLSIFVENKEGKLVTITDAIANAKIDIRAMSVADTQDFGICRLIVTDPEKAKEALESSGCFVSITQVVGVDIPDEPGSLAKVLNILARHNINIEYMYAFITISKKNASVVLRVADNEKAEAILKENGIKLLEESEISAI